MFDKLKQQPLLWLALAFAAGLVVAHVANRVIDLTYEDALGSDPVQALVWMLLLGLACAAVYGLRSAWKRLQSLNEVTMSGDWVTQECGKQVRRKIVRWLISMPIAVAIAYACDVSLQSGWPGILLLAPYIVTLWLFFRPTYNLAKDISQHPVVQTVEKWTDRDRIIASAQRESDTSVLFKKNGIAITRNFVIVRHATTFNLFRLDHLLWGYRKQTTYRMNLIPYMKSHEAVLHFEVGDLSISAPKKYVNDVLEHCRKTVPWAFFGYDAELQQAFNHSRKTVTDVVFKRRVARLCWPSSRKSSQRIDQQPATIAQ